MPNMQFAKMHGCGNDYIYVDCTQQVLADPSRIARLVADRHFGVGSDGLILVCRSEVADVRMEMYNADGSRGAMCGNGVRCVGKFAVDNGLAGVGVTVGPLPPERLLDWLAAPAAAALGEELRTVMQITIRKRAAESDAPWSIRPVRVETDAGIKPLYCYGSDDGVDMVTAGVGPASLRLADVGSVLPGETAIDRAVEIAGRAYRLTCVSTGSAHAVVFADDLDAVDLEVEGPAIEHSPLFPNRINVHFVKCLSRDRLRARTWERGSGVTLACGTGACAAVVAGRATGRTDALCTVEQPGGSLSVLAGQSLWLTGPAVTVCTGVWHDC